MEGLTNVQIVVTQGETGVAFAILTDVDEVGHVVSSVKDLSVQDLEDLARILVGE